MLKAISSTTNALGALNYKGTWNASTNTPTLTSSVGAKGDYYVVSVAGSTNLNGISNWGIGDLATFNGSVWQRVESGADGNFVNLSVSGTSTLSNLTASTALALDASKNVVSVTNTGTGDNVLGTNPTLAGATLSGTVAGGGNQLNNVIIGTTTPLTGAFTTVSAIHGTSEPALTLRSTLAADAGNALIRFIKASATNTTSQIFTQFVISGNNINSGQINANGASAAAFGTFSDVRLKENIENLPSQLNNIMALRPVEFDYKDGSGHQIGFVAQEMEQVYSDAIGVGENEMLTVTGWSKTEARLVKAIQEQQALITQLTARITALENK